MKGKVHYFGPYRGYSYYPICGTSLAFWVHDGDGMGPATLTADRNDVTCKNCLKAMKKGS